MTLEDFRKRFTSFRELVDREALEMRDTFYALERLRAFYEQLSPSERVLANEVLSEWVMADDESRRFDAIVLIDKYKVTTAIPALQQLLTRLACSSAPGAPFEKEKAERILDDLRE